MTLFFSLVFVIRKYRSLINVFLDPSFVHTVAYKDVVLFFFREMAVEHTNCGKVSKYSKRVVLKTFKNVNPIKFYSG